VLASSLRPGGGLFALAIDSLDDPTPGPWRIWPVDARAEEEGFAGDPACPGPPDGSVFHSHGLSHRALEPGRVRVAVVNHAPREAIELFDLTGAGRDAVLRWVGCVELPPDDTGNDVALGSDGRIFVTSFVPRGDGIWRSILESAAAIGIDTGKVIEWTPSAKWRIVPGSEGAGPNGIALAPDERFLCVAENGGQRVMRVPLQSGGSPAVAELGHNVDNLSWTAEGTLLAVVHRGGFETILESCLMRWSLLEVDLASMTATERLRHDGEVLCGATVAIRIGRRYLIGSMSEARIGIFEPDAEDARAARRPKQ
jgi:hypothetical protein